MPRFVPRGKILRIEFFHKNGLCSVIIFLQSTSILLCHILLERPTKTEENGI